MAIQQKGNYRRNRPISVESLETRALMAAEVFHNFLFPHDVDDDGALTPLDALVVINAINRGDDAPTGDRKFQDVDDDSRVTPLDALVLINALNVQTSPSIGQSQTFKGSNGTLRARVELETEGSETELKIGLDNAPPSSSFDVKLNDIALGQLMTDVRGRGRLVLGHGDDNSNHLPLPDSLTRLDPAMELIIGDLVTAKLSQLNVESHSNSNENNSSSSGSLNLVAKFNALSSPRSAEYEQESENGLPKRSFEAEIEKAAPNATFEVHVNDVLVGSIVTDKNGKGKLRLSTTPKDARDQLMPATFPSVTVGTTINIGTAAATFQKNV